MSDLSDLTDSSDLSDKDSPENVPDDKHPRGCSGGLSFRRVHFALSNGGGGLALGEGEELVAEIFVLLTAKLYLTGQPLLD